MASFTDAISTFNPYVQELPVEAMAKVGMYKQAKYEEGVQKVQSQLDQVYGLSVSRPVDKQYLESKLGELNNNLRVVAAGDFSNQQLVNSVGGMAGQISKDPYIQSAIYSTAHIKQNEAIMAEARKKGELADENVYDYQEQLGSYMNGQLGDTFNGQYVPYRNVIKKLKEIGDMVGIDGTKVEQMFETDERGNKIEEYTTDKKGNRVFKGYKWSPIKVTETLKGKDAAKILSMFEAALEPADYKQLAMTGRFKYRDSTPDQLVSMAEHSYNTQLKDLDGAIEEQRLYLFNAENSAKPNKEDIIAHAQLYKSLSKQRDFVDNNRKKTVEQVLSNPDAAKASLYTSSYLSTISLGMSSQDRDVDSDVSPYFKINESNRNYDLAVETKRLDNYWKSKNYSLAERNANREDLAFQLKFGMSANGKPLGLPDEIDIEKEGVASQIVDQVDKSYSSLIANSNGLAYKLTSDYIKSLPGNENLNDQQLTAKIASTLKKYNAPIVEGEENPILSKFALKMVAKWNKDRGSVPFESQGLIDRYSKSIEEVTYARTGMQDVDKQTERIAKEQGIDVKAIADIEKSIKPFTIPIQVIDRSKGMFASNVSPVTGVTLDKTDVRNIAKIGIADWTLAPSSEQEKLASASAKEQLLTKYGPLKTQAILTSVGFTSGGNIVPQVKDLMDKYADSHSDKLSKIKAQIYKDRNYITQGTRVPLYTDESNKALVGDKVATVLNKYKSVIPEADAQELVKGITDGKFKADLDTRGVGLGGETTHSLEVNGKNIPISSQDYAFLANMNPPENRGVPGFVRQLDSKGTSNITGTINPNSGNLYKDADFTNFKSDRYTLTGDLVTDKDNPSIYWLKIFKHDKLGKEETKTISYDRAIPKMDKDDRGINPNLRYVSVGINNNVLQQLENK